MSPVLKSNTEFQQEGIKRTGGPKRRRERKMTETGEWQSEKPEGSQDREAEWMENGGQ